MVFQRLCPSKGTSRELNKTKIGLHARKTLSMVVYFKCYQFKTDEKDGLNGYHNSYEEEGSSCVWDPFEVVVVLVVVLGYLGCLPGFELGFGFDDYFLHAHHDFLYYFCFSCEQQRLLLFL